MPEGAGARRGRFEKAFAQIGGACMIGEAEIITQHISCSVICF